MEALLSLWGCSASARPLWRPNLPKLKLRACMKLTQNTFLLLLSVLLTKQAGSTIKYTHTHNKGPGHTS